MAAENRRSIVVRMPDWVPPAALNYLVHTEMGMSIRALARASDCHASTILRQVRRYENRRDDPLVDDALRRLSRHVPRPTVQDEEAAQPMTIDIRRSAVGADDKPSEARIAAEGLRILRRLCEAGAVLAVARDMDTAVVVRDVPGGETTRTATVGCDVAQAMALREWISCAEPGARVVRYRITNTGRAELKKLMAADENRAVQGFSEARAEFRGRAAEIEDLAGDDGFDGRGMRYALGESPLIGLSRRRDKDGQPFLTRDLVAAGERLREDFELANMGPKVTTDWTGFLTGPSRGVGGGGQGGAEAAHGRVAAALADLGPGLGDVVLRCCCFLEGLEQAEKKLGWAARSGKIVLRIALQRLRRHYEETQGKYGPKIG
ncbi:DUF6456 domain-containing protein [Marivivens marinus]|uniref:DUF6456 domain-containing protein n=1 Tax=Marivivens marinus TaxID=3110173 RepID=UPI003B849084